MVAFVFPRGGTHMKTQLACARASAARLLRVERAALKPRTELRRMFSHGRQGRKLNQHCRKIKRYFVSPCALTETFRLSQEREPWGQTPRSKEFCTHRAKWFTHNGVSSESETIEWSAHVERTEAHQKPKDHSPSFGPPHPDLDVIPQFLKCLPQRITPWIPLRFQAASPPPTKFPFPF